VLWWTVLIDSSLVGWTVLIEIIALKTILVVVLLSRLMKSWWTHLIRIILTVLNEISDCCGNTNFRDRFKRCSRSDERNFHFVERFFKCSCVYRAYLLGLQLSAEDQKSLSEKKKRGAFVFALTSVTLLLECLTFDLLSMIDKHSRGILSKKFPPAAESSAS
nr:hypothetical protein [Tanacetum cinerariifolium]